MRFLKKDNTFFELKRQDFIDFIQRQLAKIYSRRRDSLTSCSSKLPLSPSTYEYYRMNVKKETYCTCKTLQTRTVLIVKLQSYKSVKIFLLGD